MYVLCVPSHCKFMRAVLGEEEGGFDCDACEWNCAPRRSELWPKLVRIYGKCCDMGVR